MARLSWKDSSRLVMHTVHPCASVPGCGRVLNMDATNLMTGDERPFNDFSLSLPPPTPFCSNLPIDLNETGQTNLRLETL